MDEPDPGRIPRYVMITFGAVAAAIVAAAALIVTLNPPGRKPEPTPAPTSIIAAPAPTWAPSSPAVPDDTMISWAHLDSTDGTITSGGDTGTQPLDRLVVPGLAAAYLDRLAQAGRTMNPKQTSVIFSALNQSPDGAAELEDLAGPVDQAVTQIIDDCQLTETETGPPRATVADLARYGACLREGGIADPETSAWVLDQMRNTAGGIGDVRGNDGGQRLAQFNTTTDLGQGRARTSCLGIGAYWSGAVVVDWPTERGDMFGVAVCAEVARVQFPPDTQQAPAPPTPAHTT